jgi:hypothetical protein
VRKLIFIRGARYYRDFVSAGAFEAIEDDDTYYVSGTGSVSKLFDGHPRHVASLEMPKWRGGAYAEARKLLLTSYRFRSRTARVKLNQLPLAERTRRKLAAAPGLRQWRIRNALRTTGLWPELHTTIEQLRPDIVIAPSSGIDMQIFDAIRSARALGIPSLALLFNWDNLSSKAAFVVPPDYMGVIGHQSAQHARQIHRIPPERVRVLGSPYIDHHFRHDPGSTESPFPFRYVLFAGCYQPFDELTAIEGLERTIEDEGLELKVVYLPHRWRLRRKRPDFVDESRFKHVVLEPRISRPYLDSWERDRGEAYQASKTMDMDFLPLDYYPALLENAEFVVCPLSTMMLEAAIFRRRVIAIAYHDGLHPTSPGVAINYLHYDGVDRVENFEVCREMSDLGPLFTKLARDRRPAKRPPKEQMDWWIYHDERPFGERLAEFVAEIAGAPRPSPVRVP